MTIHAPGRTDETPLLGRTQCLVVDDSAAVRETLVAMLKILGVEGVRAVDNGCSALEILEDLDGKPCTLFCDLAMPGMDGVQVVGEMAKRRLDVNLILMSGKDPRLLQIVSEVARDAGHRVVGIVCKPFDQHDIASILREQALQQLAPSQDAPADLSPAQIEAAIHEGRVDVVFEPQVDLRSGRVVGAEALARIRSPEGLIPPARFIGVAETAGLIGAVTDIVIQRATEHAGHWWSRGHALDLGINLSISLASEPWMPAHLAAACGRHRVPTGRVIVEITESGAAALRSVMACVARFRLLDFRVAIDDFGIGHSSFERLQKVPFSDLKIDRSFVTDAGVDPDKQSIIESSVQLAHRLRLKVIAEGIETLDDQRTMTRLGCDAGQGYLYMRPDTSSAMLEKIKRIEALHPAANQAGQGDSQ